MWKLIKSLFINGNTKIRNVKGSYSDYLNILNVKFSDINTINLLSDDLIIQIINNDYFADPAQIISFFKNKYDLTINEFIALMFNLGMAAQIYIDKPLVLLESAVEMEDAFSVEEIEMFQDRIINLERQEDFNMQRKIKAYEVSKTVKSNKIDLKDTSKATKNNVDEYIDVWIEEGKKKKEKAKNKKDDTE